MSDLTQFRDHCARMAEAEHRPECASLRPKPYWSAWDLAEDGSHMTWRGPEPKWWPKPCNCALSDAERALFRQLAGEVDNYLAPQPDLFGGVSDEPGEGS